MFRLWILLFPLLCSMEEISAYVLTLMTASLFPVLFWNISSSTPGLESSISLHEMPGQQIAISVSCRPPVTYEPRTSIPCMNLKLAELGWFKVLLHPKWKFCHWLGYSPSCRSKPVRLLFIFGTQIKIFLMKSEWLQSILWRDATVCKK